MIIGIDPGGQGGIAHLKPNGEVLELFVMPTIGKEVDIHQLSELIPFHAEQVFLEDVGAIMGVPVSKQTMFNFGRNLGLIEGIIVAKQLSYVKVKPKEWQKEMFRGVPELKKPGKGKKLTRDTKKMALVAAKRLYPGQDLSKSGISRKEHDGFVDALLIGAWGARNA